MSKVDELRKWYEASRVSTPDDYLKKLKIAEAELKVRLLELELKKLQQERVETYDYFARDADELAADGE